MDLKEKLVAAFMAFENKDHIDIDSKVHDIRYKAMENFENMGFPTKKDEDWKYTSLKPVLKYDYNIFPKMENNVELKDVKKYFLHEIESYKIVFVDGVYSSFLSSTTHERSDICILSAALKKPRYKMVIDHYYDKVADNTNSITSLNTAFAREGAYIHIPKNTVLEKPIQLLFFSTGNESEMMLNPRNLIIIGENSHVQIFERHQNLADNTVLTNSVTEIFAHKRAIINYYKVQNDHKKVSMIDHTYVQQKDNSIVSINTFSFGGKLIRNSIHVAHKGEYLTTNLNGISIIGDTQHVDNHTLIHHQKENCESFELYKGIYDGTATGVFNGKVIVDPEAQKTNAFQQNDNILIGKKATIDTKPQLEIFADDVKCSHGCTIGELDEKALFYLQSRGIPKKEAKALLLFAFGNEVIEKIKIPALKSRIIKLIAKKLNVEIGFEM
jgi:Fe-S cluster assembly protein SufD